MNAILFIINVKEDEIVDETRNPQWVCLNLYPNIWELNNWVPLQLSGNYQSVEPP